MNTRVIWIHTTSGERYLVLLNDDHEVVEAAGPLAENDLVVAALAGDYTDDPALAQKLDQAPDADYAVYDMADLLCAWTHALPVFRAAQHLGYRAFWDQANVDSARQTVHREIVACCAELTTYIGEWIDGSDLAADATPEAIAAEWDETTKEPNDA